MTAGTSVAGSHWFGWRNLSVIGAISWWRILFRIHAGAIKAPQVVDFLKVLHRHIRQPKMIISDGVPIHRSKLVTQYVASTEGRIAIERLPTYAPELNPAEYIWAHLKQHEIGNLLVREAWQLSHHATAALRKIRRRPRIIRACFAQAELWPESSLDYASLSRSQKFSKCKVDVTRKRVMLALH